MKPDLQAIKKTRVILISLFIISLLFNFSFSYSQEKLQKLYRIHVKDFKKIQSIEKTGINVYNAKSETYIDVLASDEQINNLKISGIEIEFLSESFKDLVESQMSPQSLAQYHDHAATMAELINIANTYPAITKFDTIGHSVLGRAICSIKISDNPDVDEDETPILIVGNHHGNEILSVEASLYNLNYLVNNYGTDAEVTSWVDNMEIWFVPMLNPDGREAMRRTNENGVDLNRNYSYEHTATGNHGPEGFSEPETQTIRDLAALYPPALSLTYHTSGRLLLLPWTHTDAAAPDSAAFSYLGEIICQSITYPGGYYELRQGGDWYFTAGEYCDYMYATHNTMAFTVEMWERQSPDAEVIPQVVERNLEGFLTLLRQAGKAGISGLITDASTGLPIEATIDIPSIYDQGKLPPRKADAQFGRFYRYLAPGEYTINISAPGYRTMVNDIVIYADSLTTLNVQMDPAAYIIVDNIEVDDIPHGRIQGNGDGNLNINETAGIFIDLSNQNELPANQIYAKISSKNSYVNFLSDSTFYGDIAGNTNATTADTIIFYLDPGCPDGELLEFNLSIGDSGGAGWTEQFFLEVFAPDIKINFMRIDDSDGNGNNIIDNGETGIVDIVVTNTGRQELTGLNGVLRTEDPYYQIVSETSHNDGIGIQQDGSFVFSVSLDQNTPAAYMADLQLEISSSELFSRILDIRLHNINGLFDDFEGETENWTHASYGTTPNSHDDWQKGKPAGKAGDPSSAFSGNNCWGNDMGWDSYAGDSWNGYYQHNVFNYLRSPVIDCTGKTDVGLKYQRWLNLRSGDFAMIKVNNEMIWISPGRGMTETAWTEHIIDISEYADNNPSVTITFELRSNSSSYSGGWNIDDVMVADGLSSGGSGVESGIKNDHILFNAYPNPFNFTSTISYQLPVGGKAEINILDSFGRKIKTLVSNEHNPGNHQITWDGRNDGGDNLPTGIYFYQLKTENNISVKRIVLIN